MMTIAQFDKVINSLAHTRARIPTDQAVSPASLALAAKHTTQHWRPISSIGQVKIYRLRDGFIKVSSTDYSIVYQNVHCTNNVLCDIGATDH